MIALKLKVEVKIQRVAKFEFGLNNNYLQCGFSVFLLRNLL